MFWKVAMRYILAYFALMLGLSGLSLLWAGKAYGFVLVLISALLIYVLARMERTRRRERRSSSTCRTSATSFPAPMQTT